LRSRRARAPAAAVVTGPRPRAGRTAPRPPRTHRPAATSRAGATRPRRPGAAARPGRPRAAVPAAATRPARPAPAPTPRRDRREAVRGDWRTGRPWSALAREAGRVSAPGQAQGIGTGIAPV